ncbi:MAG: HNH endonuclease [Hyperionvirus sp.]|uniref:HNH endonuclease n=1 Tax=Hyperionvirus sp. TaxID=2487770 RepID=A0A3G5AEB5_9VIRU|nr:MAG: HNH endonuclease [Hyperionvirus sp.]
MKFNCELCGFECEYRSEFLTHTGTAKHIKRTKEKDEEKKFECVVCNYKCKYRSEYEKHTRTAKHINQVKEKELVGAPIDEQINQIKVKELVAACVDEQINQIKVKELVGACVDEHLKKIDENNNKHLLEKIQQLIEEKNQLLVEKNEVAKGAKEYIGKYNKACLQNDRLRTKNRALVKSYKSFLNQKNVVVSKEVFQDQINEFEEKPDDYDEEDDMDITEEIISEQAINQKDTIVTKNDLESEDCKTSDTVESFDGDEQIIYDDKLSGKIKKISPFKYVKVPARTREKVWLKYNGRTFDAPCYVCSDNITNNNYECGHIISRADGGEVEIDNLRPICRPCNLSIKCQNMREYVQIYECKSRLLAEQSTVTAV